jgi:peptidylprolyl isomerase
MMKCATSILLLSAFPVLAQTTAPAAKAPATATTKTAVHKTGSAASACAKLPDISPKVPALPAGLPCAKHIYTISTAPPARVENIAPFENADQLRETLRIQEPTSFSLDYVDIYPGSGAPAAPKKWLTVEYTGYLIDGTKFDSSADHPGTPFSFLYGQIGGPGSAVVGWETGFGGMKVGAKRRLYVPQQLGYGVQTKGNIPPKSMLIFDVKLVAVSDTDPNPKPAPKAPTPGGTMGGIPRTVPTPTPTPTPAPKPATPAPATTTTPAPTTPPAAAPTTPPATTTPKP